MRYNSISVASMTRPGRERKRRLSKPEHDDFSNDDDDSPRPAALLPRMMCKSSVRKNTICFLLSHSRREEIGRQCTKSEQRRRDELRDGYRRLKDALPVSNQKSSKVSLLDRATTTSSTWR
jgi:hypothetical protein